MTEVNVNFIIQVHRDRDVNLDSVVERLQTEGVTVSAKLKSTRQLICATDPATYSARLNVELAYDETMAGKPGYTTNGYKEQGKTTIPEDWKDFAKIVHLSSFLKKNEASPFDIERDPLYGGRKPYDKLY